MLLREFYFANFVILRVFAKFGCEFRLNVVALQCRDCNNGGNLEGESLGCLRQPYFLGDGIYKVYTGVDIPYYGCVGAYLLIYVLLYIKTC